MQVTQRGRTLRAEWRVGEPYEDEDERGTVTELAVLTVRHHGKAQLYGYPEYVYTASLDRQRDIQTEAGRIRSQTFGVGEASYVEIGKREAKRYSEKRAREFFDEMVWRVEEFRKQGLAAVAAVFGEEAGCST